MTTLSAETQSKMLVWRQKALDGTITEVEMTEAIKILRGDRVAAAKATPTKRASAAKKVIPKAADLLAELGIEEEETPAAEPDEEGDEE